MLLYGGGVAGAYFYISLDAIAAFEYAREYGLGIGVLDKVNAKEAEGEMGGDRFTVVGIFRIGEKAVGDSTAEVWNWRFI